MPNDKIDILIEHALELITMKGSPKPRTRDELQSLGIITNGAVAIKDEKIVDVGKTDIMKSRYDAETVLDARKKLVMPGFVDCHNHLIFGGSREFELEWKIKGLSYVEIQQQGGGILRTVQETRRSSLEKLVEDGKKRLDHMLKSGTTTTEAKTGYGLNLNDEIKMLKALQMLHYTHVIDVVPTFLGAHALAPEFRSYDEYTEALVHHIIPQVAELKIAEFCDVFCDVDFFSVEQSRRILTKARMVGMRPKVHADELTESGGAELAAEMGAISAEHLTYPSSRGLKMMAEKGIIGVLLPASTYGMLDSSYADAQRIKKAGVPIALATDLTPNSWTENMQFVISLACYEMKMLPSEVITAATINAAHAINRANEIGSLEPGKLADIIILDVPNHKHIPYHYGTNLIDMVIKKGKIVL